MKKIPEDIVDFFHRQSFVIVSTIDKNGTAHAACKGIVKISQNRKVYLLDLYKGRTFANLKRNPQISITAVNEHKFIGFCLQGKAKVVKGNKLSSHIITAWEQRITKRITQRVFKNVGGDKGHAKHPELLLPKPEYMIAMTAERIIDLTPRHLK